MPKEDKKSLLSFLGGAGLTARGAQYALTKPDKAAVTYTGVESGGEGHKTLGKNYIKHLKNKNIDAEDLDTTKGKN